MRTVGDTPRTDRANNADAEHEFQAFYAAHYAQLVAQGTMLSDSLQEAEDAAQEACMAAMAKWDTIRSPYHWTKKAMSRKLVRDRQIRRARWYQRLLPQSPPDLEIPVPPRSSVDEQMRALDVLAALRQLPSRQRQVMILLAECELDHREIAELLGTTPNNVSVNVHHARRKLRLLLGQGSEPVPAGDSLDSVRRDDPLYALIHSTAVWLRLGIHAKQRADRKEGNR